MIGIAVKSFIHNFFCRFVLVVDAEFDFAVDERSMNDEVVGRSIRLVDDDAIGRLISSAIEYV